MVLGRFLVVWRVFGGVLGGPENLGGILESLGGVLGGLGPSWVVLDPTRWARQPTWAEPRWSQDEAKMRPKRDQNRCQERTRQKKFLKIVLEPSWVDLDSFWAASWGRRMGLRLGETAFREKSRF